MTRPPSRALPEVPRSADSDSVIAGIQPLVTTGLLLTTLVSLHGLSGHGLGLYAAVLLAICVVQAYSRSLPDRWMPPRARLGAATVATVAAGLLFGVGLNSWAVGFGYLLTSHLGFRFPVRTALALTATAAGVTCLAIGLGPHLTGDGWPWWVGLTVAGPVVGGLARQNRSRTLANARELVAQTRRAAASEAEAGALAERNRIARELHDVLAHSLSGVSLQLDAADALIEAGRVEEGRASIQAARLLAVDGLVQARDAVSTLREDLIDLGAALATSVQGTERLVIEGPIEDLPSPVARTILRIVQEALTNARRHAPGAVTTAEVTRAEDLRIAVRNSAPPTPTAPFELGGGQGLVGMRERAAALGGGFHAGPRDGGWEVLVTLPVPRSVTR